MLCVHRLRWLQDVKEKIIMAIDDIDDRERIPGDFGFYSEF